MEITLATWITTGTGSYVIKRPPEKTGTSSKFKGNFRIVIAEDVHKNLNVTDLYILLIIIIIIIIII